VPVSDYTPDLTDVGAIDMARTVDDVGKETGTFSDPDAVTGAGATRPTATQVTLLINRSLQEVAPRLGTDIPTDLFDDGKYLVSLRTAMWVELTYYAAEVALDRSPYPEYKVLFDEGLINLTGAIQAEEAGLDPSDSLNANMPFYSFPDDIDLLERPF
jgi:hypothetical protein